jgi:hypothetical protein
MRWAILILAVAVGPLTGCKNAIVGKWESDGDLPGCNSGGDFRIDDNKLQGDGSLTLTDGQSCLDCSFDLDATDEGDHEYTVNIDMNNCTIDNSTRIKLTCTIDKDRLDCDAEQPSVLKGADISPYDRWDKVD